MEPPGRAALRRVLACPRPPGRDRRRHRRPRRGRTSCTGVDAGRSPARVSLCGHGEQRLQPTGGTTGHSGEQPAAGAVGDGRFDAGPAEPGGVRAAALERTVEYVLCARPRGGAAGRDEPVGGGNGRARERAVPAARGGRADGPRQRRWAGLKRAGPVRRLPLRLLHARGGAGGDRVPRARGEAARRCHRDGVARRGLEVRVPCGRHAGDGSDPRPDGLRPVERFCAPLRRCWAVARFRRRCCCCC